MARPKKCRQVSRLPRALYFKPRGIPMRELTEVYLPIEGAEALRLVDSKGLDQQSASVRMNVSRHTLGRILAQARQVVARAITEGMAIRIEGGNFIIKGQDKPRRIGGTVPKCMKDTGVGQMKKIAVSSEGPVLDDQVDPRFGRAGGFLIVDPETMECEYIENGAGQVMGQGAGIQAAEIVAGAGAGVVLSGYVGPKAFNALTTAGIKVGQDCENMTVRDAVEKYTRGEIALADQPDGGAGA